MREYREDKRKGVQRAPKEVKVTASEVAWAREQREAGRTYRAIAADLGVDYSYLARRVKQG